MPRELPPFFFVGDVNELPIEYDFVLKIPTEVRSEENLLLHYEKEGKFPGWFGRNWDALLDCLRDFSWVTERRIVVIHEDLPLSNDARELRIYLEILQTAVNDWKEVRKGPFAELPKEWPPFVEHELLVAFPSSVQAAITATLGDK
jgi:Barstar (barnase inhibitor)